MTLRSFVCFFFCFIVYTRDLIGCTHSSVKFVLHEIQHRRRSRRAQHFGWRWAFKDLRTALIFGLGFNGLFRISELLDLQATDITTHEGHLEISVKSSKTDQYREGNKVFISKTGGITCPHSLVCRFFASAGIHRDSPVYILRAVKFLKKVNSYVFRP